MQSKLKIKEVEVKETKNIDQVETAVKALKAKVKNPRRLKQLKLAELARLDGKGNILESQKDFVNEIEANLEVEKSIWRPQIKTEDNEDEEPHIEFELESEDGAFKAVSKDIDDLWKMVFDAVQEAREKNGLPQMEAINRQSGLQMIGLTHVALAFLLEQLPNANRC